MGDHEGLGLGFYESIACGTPVFTINTPPNNEIIIEGKNGWLVNCDYTPLTDNNEGIVQKAVINVQDLKNKMLDIINTYDRKQMSDSTVKDYYDRFSFIDYQKKIIDNFVSQ